MSNVFWKAKTECSYLDGASQTWYIIDTFAWQDPEMTHHIEKSQAGEEF